MPGILHGGEYVLDAGTVDAIKRGRPSEGSANGRGYASAVNGNGGTTLVIQIQAGHVISERSFMEMVIEGISKAQGQGYSVPYLS